MLNWAFERDFFPPFMEDWENFQKQQQYTAAWEFRKSEMCAEISSKMDIVWSKVVLTTKLWHSHSSTPDNKITWSRTWISHSEVVKPRYDTGFSQSFLFKTDLQSRLIVSLRIKTEECENCVNCGGGLYREKCSHRVPNFNAKENTLIAQWASAWNILPLDILSFHTDSWAFLTVNVEL